MRGAASAAGRRHRTAWRELGPGGGDAGGRIVAQGPPEKLVRTRRRSETAQVLQGFLDTRVANWMQV